MSGTWGGGMESEGESDLLGEWHVQKLFPHYQQLSTWVHVGIILRVFKYGCLGSVLSSLNGMGLGHGLSIRPLKVKVRTTTLAGISHCRE